MKLYLYNDIVEVDGAFMIVEVKRNSIARRGGDIGVTKVVAGHDVDVDDGPSISPPSPSFCDPYSVSEIRRVFTDSVTTLGTCVCRLEERRRISLSSRLAFNSRSRSHFQWIQIAQENRLLDVLVGRKAHWKAQHTSRARPTNRPTASSPTTKRRLCSTYAPS